MLDEDKVLKAMKEMTLDFDFEEMDRKMYEEDREYPENFSNWYSHIVDFGDFDHVDIVANQIFTLEETKIMRKWETIDEVDWNQINKILEPTINKMQPGLGYSIKNGSFSNKFDFQTSIATRYTLAKQLWQINYMSSMLDTGGYTELVVRKLIPHTLQPQVPTIYNGMPLRDEIRVFYNMDTEEMEYWVDYWDYNYCKDGIRDISDKIVFDYFHGKLENIETGKQNNLHSDFIGYVAGKDITERIKTLKFDGELKGIWSIDFLYQDGKCYLIDMARGFRSAYWDAYKMNNK